MPDHSFPSLSALDGTLWTCEPTALRMSVARVMRAPCPTSREIVEERRRRLDEARQCAAKAVRGVKGRVGVIAIHGPVEQRMSSELMKLGGTSTEEVGMALDSLMADKTVEAVIFHIDSPGGSSYGVQELSDKIFAARQQKKTYAIADSMAASAAYWIASAAETLAVTPGGDVGSVGVYAVHVDESKAMELEGVKVTLVKAGKFKAEFAPYSPLDPVAQDHLQELVDGTYQKFLGGLKRNRGTTLEDVRRNYGEGRIVPAEDALARKMVDRVMSFEDLLGRLTGGTTSNGRAAEMVEVLRLRQEHRKRTASV